VRRAALALLLFAAAAAHAQYEESITVTRYVVHVQVTGANGEAIPDLMPEDFTVTLGGKPAYVESIRWQNAKGRDAVREGEDGELEVIEAPRGRLFVFFIQTVVPHTAAHLRGQMHFNLVADRILELMGPDDRVAVFSYDSQLKFRLDFTADRKAIRDAIRRCVRIDRPPVPPEVDEPSLARYFDVEGARRAKTSEHALLVLANALANIEGPKTILLAGSGLGRRSSLRVTLHHSWTDALHLLVENHTTVIALGTGTGGSLSVGLAHAARATGGFFVHTTEFAQQAVNRLQHAITGAYELTLRTDEQLEQGEHTLHVRVARHNAIVQAPSIVIHH
jgi:VWFA-related protein